MDEKIAVGKQTKRVVFDDYVVLRVDSEGRLIVVTAVGAPLLCDVIDRAGRLVGIVYGENAQLQQLTPADGVAPNQSLESASFLMVYDPVAGDWNRVREGSVVGSIITEDTGLNTNPERWLHDNHWDSGAELVLNAAAAVNLGAPVAVGAKRRVRSITVRNTAQANTVITLSQVAPAQNRLSFDVLAQTTRTWSEQDGVEFLTGVQVQISSSAAAGGAETYIHASGVEA